MRCDGLCDPVSKLSRSLLMRGLALTRFGPGGSIPTRFRPVLFVRSEDEHRADTHKVAGGEANAASPPERNQQGAPTGAALLPIRVVHHGGASEEDSPKNGIRRRVRVGDTD